MTFDIAKAKLTVTVIDQSYVYNGKQQGESDTAYDDPAVIAKKVNVVGLKGSDAITSIVLDGEETNIGVYDKAITITSIAVGTEGAKNGSYDITLNPGTLTITGLPLTITADSAEKVYDGKPLTKDSYTSSGLVGDDSIERITITGAQTEAGSSKNVPSAVKVVNKDGEDVTGNYEGKMTVTYKITPRSVTITSASANKQYDGAALTSDTVTVTVESIDDDANALAGNQSTWSLFDLICTILTTLLAAIMVIFAIGSNRKEGEGGESAVQEPNEVYKRKRILRIASIVPAVGAIIALILTQDFSSLMAIFDQWSILFAILAIVNIVLAVASRKKTDGNGEDGQQTMQSGFVPAGPASL